MINNKGKECTAKEIAEWINYNNFSLGTTITSSNISNLLKSAGINRHSHIYNDVYVCKGNPNTYIIGDG